MSLVGTLSTMPLTDLLQWMATAGKTGALQIERRKIAKWIMMRDGRVVGCSSDDPPQRLGQYLISKEKISEEQLRRALATQEQTPKHLGAILVEMGAIGPGDLAEHLESKAEETIYSLFDWDDGVFRFREGLEQRKNVFQVDLQVQDILLRGLKRYDEMRRVRELFHDPGIVLRYTSIPPGPEIFGDSTARSMYSAIDGDRTIAEILLHVHGTEYGVYTFLFELHRKGYVEIAGVKSIETPPSRETRPPSPPPNREAPAAGRPAGDATAAPAAGVATAVAVAPPKPPAEPVGLDSQVASARRLMAEGKLEAALDILDALYRANPGDDALRRVSAEAEAAFIERAYRHVVPADKIPVLTRPVEALGSEALTPHEFFLLSRMDGSWDVKSIIQVAPLREVDALRTLKRMRELGMIDLREPS